MSKAKSKSKPTHFFKVSNHPVIIEKKKNYMDIVIYSHSGSTTLSFWKADSVKENGGISGAMKDVTQLRDALNEVLEFLGEEE